MKTHLPFLISDGKYSRSGSVADDRKHEGHQTDASHLESSTIDNTPSTKTCGDHCVVCGTLSSKTCGRCKIIIYCSTTCQKQHWTVHKHECVKVDGVLKTPGSQEYDMNLQDDQQAQPHSHHGNLFDYMFPMKSLFRSERKMPFDKAKARCVRLFPLKRIIGTFQQVPGEFFGLRPPCQGDVLLVFICGWHYHSIRHGVFIRVRI